MSAKPLVTIGLSSHRLEVLPYAGEVMARHEAIALEEAPEADFADLLAGKLPEMDYLADKEVEFPEFSHGQLALLTDLHRQGRAVLQVEPYLERLIRIHELLADGVPRGEVESRPEFREIYAVESRTSRTLLAFYAAAHVAPFPRVVAAVQDFARADGARFRLRDELRAAALAPLAARYARLYVEAGHITCIW